jgi:hypothetical protein
MIVNDVRGSSDDGILLLEGFYRHRRVNYSSQRLIEYLYRLTKL